MALPKLYDLITWHNNTTPALNEDNLNAMSQAIDDIDDRVIDLAGTIMEDVPQIIEDMAILEPAIESIDENVARAEAAAESAEQYAEEIAPPIEVVKDFAPIITLEDAINKPVKDLKVKVDPVQDLHGYTKPWVGGAGKNLLKTTGTSTTNVGVSYTVNSDGTIPVNGTADISGSGQDTSLFVVGSIELEGGVTYVLSSSATNDNDFFLQLVGSGISDINTKSGAKTFTPSASLTATARIIVNNGKTVSNITIKPMVCLSTASNPTTFEPYTNICPISGWDNAKVTRSEKNLLSGIEQGAYVATSGYPISSDKYCRTKKVKIKGGATVAFSIVTSKTTALTPLYWNGDAFVGHGDTSENVSSVTATIPENADTIAFDIYNSTALSTTDITSAQIEVGTTPTSHTEYISPTTYTIDLGGTRYGGVLDVDAGTLTLTHEVVDLGDLSWTYKNDTRTYFYASYSGIKSSGNPNTNAINAICSCYNVVNRDTMFTTTGTLAGDGTMTTITQIQINDTRYSDTSTFTTAVTGQTLVYELATPQTITLTPTEVELLLGYNTLWADTGDLSLTYDASGVLRIANAKLDIDTFKSVVAASSDFADFKTRVAAL